MNINTPSISELLERINLLEKENSQLHGLLEEKDTIINHVQESIAHYTLDTTGNPICNYVSPQIIDLTGYDLHFLNQQESGFYVVHPDDLDFVKNTLRIYFGLNNLDDSIEYRIVHRSGAIRWVSEHISIVSQSDMLRLVGVKRDITHIKEIDEQLKEGESRFRILLEATFGIAIQGYSSEGIVKYWNRASEELYGYSAQEAIGKNLLDLIIPMSMREEVSQEIASMILTGTCVPAQELMLMRKDGSYVPVISSHTVIAFPGREPEIFCIDIDLSQRRKIEAELVDSESKYRTLFEANRDGISIFFVNPDGTFGRFEEMNNFAAAMLGYTKEEFTLLSPNDLEEITDNQALINRKAQLESKGFFYFETSLRHKDGHFIMVEVMAVIIQYRGRIAMMNIVRDISARKGAEQALLQSERILREAQEVARVGHYIYHLKDGYWESSPVLDEIFGIDSHYEHSLNGWFSLIAPEQREMLSDHLDTCIKEYGRFKKDYKIIRVCDGFERWVSGLGEIEYDANGAAIRMIGTIQDITDRIQSQQEIILAKERAEASEQLLRQSETQLKLKLDRILSPETEMAELSLVDIVDLEQLQILQEAFSKATGVASVITDIYGSPLTNPSNFSGVCGLIRQTPLGKARCEASDRLVGEKAAITKTAHIETCKGCGFIDAGAPIYVGNKLVGIWMIGQASHGLVDEERLASYALEVGANPADILTEYRKMSNMSVEQFTAITNLLQVFANELSSLAYQNILLARKIQDQKESEEKLTQAKEIAEENERLVKEKNDAYWSLNEELTEANAQLEESNQVIQENAEKIKEREVILNSVINNIPFDLWARDMNGVCFLQNDTSKLFWGSMQGKTPKEMEIPKETLDLWLRNNARIKGGATFNEEMEFVDAFGVTRNVNSIVAPIIENDQILGILGLDIDISQRKQFERDLIKAKEKAEESDRLKSSFLATMSHELRTPLNAIIGFSQILPGVKEIEKVSGFSHIINEQGKHLLGIIESMFELSMLDAGEVKVNVAEVDISSLLNAVEPFVHNSLLKWNRSQLAIRHDPFNKATNIVICSDASKLNQILIHLLDNAIKFTLQGTVEYGISVAGNDLIFYVKDTGRGIAPANFNLIFTPFRQVDDGFNREFDGVGLGLSICKKMANLLDGEITVKSELGKGSTFSLILHGAIASNNKLKHTEIEPSFVELDLEGATILVAEDDTSSQVLMEKFIADANGTVIMDGNGKDAVEVALANNQIALVLTNLKLPIINGIEVMQRIKEAKPNLPVIALTSFVMPGDQVKLVYYGFDDYLSKPIDKLELNAKLAQYLRTS
ncbi:PAS domain S-box protein [Williamwhitmania taraxaci]|uniref:histidine kinase n=1 Tax=Williamwhitmania taraxaci TaxID=1640674 RepID=A0A1G6JP36_9BACT|nr:PAS domain S-box protein [Williamwhitmania taraxaci]SDC20421.1 PAS domain S-box-containing protein [Williamwhitmania taraxaci]